MLELTAVESSDWPKMAAPKVDYSRQSVVKLWKTDVVGQPCWLPLPLFGSRLGLLARRVGRFRKAEEASA